jgi:hypothetical protein
MALLHQTAGADLDGLCKGSVSGAIIQHAEVPAIDSTVQNTVQRFLYCYFRL